MEEAQAVEVNQVYSLPVADPERPEHETLIVVKTNDEEITYHSRLARYLANQADRLIPHFYRQWEATPRATLQSLMLRMKQGVKSHEEPVLRYFMTQSFSALIGAAKLRQIMVNGTHVTAIFGLTGIEEPLFSTELSIPFSNLQIAQDIEATAPDPSLQNAA
jgi:hypothetical protein